MRPIATGLSARLHQLSGVRAIAFDVYGTLLISSGSENLEPEASRLATAPWVEQATSAAGITLSRGTAGQLSSAFRTEVARRCVEAQADGVRYPDPDIRDAWCSVLGEFSTTPTKGQVERLAVEFELYTNPVWPMPHARSTLRMLHGLVKIGIVSNAQFYTPLVLEELLGPSFGDLIPYERQVCSYQYNRAKPSFELFQVATERFKEYGIAQSECLFVGNDLRNDVWAAAACGWRTALFAGDARSLKLRKGDECCQDLQPELIFTSLEQLPPLLCGPSK